MTDSSPEAYHLELRAGESVRVRPKDEILATLDKNGRLEQMPFMPEMFQFCGRTFKVGKRAHKTCDPVNGLQSRRLSDAVHLEDLRCDGSGHNGCQAGCLIFWKEAWLTRLGAADESAPDQTGPVVCTEEDVIRGTIAKGHTAEARDATHVCQATQVAAATTPLKWWHPGQYVEDYRSGNASLMQVISAACFWVYHSLCGVGIGMGSTMRWGYDVFQKLIGGSPYPWRPGRVPKGSRTPTGALDVQEGDWVHIKDYAQILETLDQDWKNRGLYFDAEMVPYTGGAYKVLKRVNRIIDEKTGKMLRFKTDCLILDQVVCQARYAKCRKLCPRGYYLYWREVWVERMAGRGSAIGRNEQ